MNIELEVIQAIANDIQRGVSVQKAYMNNYVKLRRFALNYVTSLNEPCPKSPFTNPTELMEMLLDDITHVFAASKSSIKHSDRRKNNVLLRYLFCFICYRHRIAKLSEIGLFIGYHDHTTVIHGREDFSNGLSSKVDIYVQIWKTYMEHGNPMFTDLFRPAVKQEYSNHSPMGIAS